MKTNSKIIIFLLIAGLSVPMISFATMNYGQGLREQVRENVRENIQEKRAEWQAKWQEIKEQHKKWQEEKQEALANKSAERKSNLICNNLEKQVVKIDQVLTEREMKIEEKQTERLEKINERRENRDAKLEEHREKWEEKWEEHFAMLEEKASTSEQRQALVEFKETVQDIRASRQAAVDVAISQFRTSLDGLIADRKEKIEEAKTAYINAYNIAIQNAKQACSDGGDSSQIRETLRTALKAAKDKFNADKQAIEKMDVKKLVETRQQAFKDALDYFKKAMEKARTDLKAVFNQ